MARRYKQEEIEAIRTIICEKIIQGHSCSVIVQDLVSEGHNKFYALVLYDKAKKFIQELVQKDVNDIVTIHIQLYEHIYKKLDGLDSVKGKLKALNQKEKIIGLHQVDNFIEINNEVNMEVEVDQSYDLSQLTKRERERYNELYKKISGNVKGA